MHTEPSPYQRFIELLHEASYAAEVIDVFDLRGDGKHMQQAWAWLNAEQDNALRSLVEHVRDHAAAILAMIEPLPEKPLDEPPPGLLRRTDLSQARFTFLCRYAIGAEQAAIAADQATETATEISSPKPDR